MDPQTMERKLLRLIRENRRLKSKCQVAEDEVERLSQYDPARPGARPVSPAQASEDQR